MEGWYGGGEKCFYAGQSEGGAHGVKCSVGSSDIAETCETCYGRDATNLADYLCNSSDCKQDSNGSCIQA